MQQSQPETIRVRSRQGTSCIGLADWQANEALYRKKGWTPVCEPNAKRTPAQLMRDPPPIAKSTKPRLVHAIPWDMTIGGIQRMMLLHAPFTSKLYDVHVIHIGGQDLIILI